MFIVGWLTDKTETYSVSFVASGIVICYSGLLLLAAPVLRRCDHVAVKTDSEFEESKSDGKVDQEAAVVETLPRTSCNSN